MPPKSNLQSNLQFQHGTDASKAARQLGQRLADEIQTGKRVIWLVSGGSNITFSLEAASLLPAGTAGRLTVLLCDERYGVPGHADSNWHQLQTAGFMDLPAMSGVDFPTVIHAGVSLEQTAARYGRLVEGLLRPADIIIGQFGIGSDGHIAGILPGSVASKLIDNSPSAVAYDGGTYQRITLTPAILLRINAAYVFAYGKAKQPALEQLANQDLPISRQPAQLIKQLPEAIVFTD